MSQARRIDILLVGDDDLSPEVVATELDNNVQSILGYVVRWIDQGSDARRCPTSTAPRS